MMHRTIRIALFGALAAGTAPATLASQQLPSASELTARYVEAIGGRDAVLGKNSSYTRGHFEMPAAGLRGDLEVYASQPNRMVSVVTLPGIGTIRNGFDGAVGWALDPFQGARLLEGRELAMLRDQTNPLAGVRDPSLFTSKETVEATEVDGQPCYRVKLVWKSGIESFDCYDAETGLLVATTATNESPMGSVEVTTLFRDYKEFDGIRMASRIVQRMMGQEQVMVASSVEFDAVDPAVFELPAEIRALVGANGGTQRP